MFVVSCYLFVLLDPASAPAPAPAPARLLLSVVVGSCLLVVNGDSCLLFVVCCLMFDVCCRSSFVVLLFGVGCWLLFELF